MRLLFAAITACIALAHGAVAAENDASRQRLYIWDADRLAAVKASLEKGGADKEIAEAAALLRKEADRALHRKPGSVIDKETTPPSGDKHDYTSYSIYWWPDPAKPAGAPFVRRDGRSNLEQRAKGDRDRFKSMVEDVETLALARYIFDDMQYGEQAERVLRTWFLDPETRMNPHLRYAQAVVGLTEGRGAGVIDARGFVEMLDAVVLLRRMGAIAEADAAKLGDWFAAYLKWVTTSKQGRDERQAENNHGTWYAAQVARIALYVGDVDTARALIEEVRSHRLAAAIEQDGAQPEELKRTRSLHYSLFQLAAFAYAARMGEALGVDLWKYEADGRGSIEKALVFASPYVLDQKDWRYEQLEPYKMTPQVSNLYRLSLGHYDLAILREVYGSGPRLQPQREFAAMELP
jgi:hypothetical protein